MIVNRTALTVLPAEHEQVVPGAGTDQVAHVRSFGKAHVLRDVVAVNTQAGELDLQVSERRSLVQAI
jgi:hypothetical protein